MWLVQALTSSAARTSTLCHFCHLTQFSIHYLICFSQNWNQVISSMFHVVGCEKSISCSCLLAAACMSNAVNVILRLRRLIKVDHKLHIFNVCNQQCLVSSSDCTFIINITIKYNTNNCIIKLLQNKMQINLSITFGSGLLDPKVCALYNLDWKFTSHDKYSTC
jgi:hypothetical protein